MSKLGHQTVVEHLSSKYKGSIPNTTNKTKLNWDALPSSIIPKPTHPVVFKHWCVLRELPKTQRADPHLIIYSTKLSHWCGCYYQRKGHLEAMCSEKHLRFISASSQLKTKTWKSSLGLSMKYSLEENSLLLWIIGKSNTDLVNLLCTVTSSTQTDEGQGSEEAQRREEYVSISLTVIHFSE